MNTTKKYDVGTITVDAPYMSYRHSIELISFGGLTGRIKLGITYNSLLDPNFFNGQNDANHFCMVQGMQLSLQKKLINDTRGVFLISGDNAVEFFKNTIAQSWKYVSKTDPNRELIMNSDGTKEIRNKNGLIEYYNSDGYITSIVQNRDSYSGDSYNILTYEYTNGKLTSISDRLQTRKIVLSYTNGKVTTIALKNGETTKWYATVIYSDNEVIIRKPNSVDIVYNFATANSLLVYTQQTNGSYAQYSQKILCEKVNNVNIRVQKSYGDRLDEDMSYIGMYAIISENIVPVARLFEEVNNLKNVRTRTQYDEIKPQCSYEYIGDDMFYTVGNYNGNCKCDVKVLKKDTFLGTIPVCYDLYRYYNQSFYNNVVECRIDDIPFVAGEANIYSLTGWVKPNNITQPFSMYLKSESNTVVEEFSITPNKYGDYWQFFQYDFYLTENPSNSRLYVCIDSATDASLGDVRIVPVDKKTMRSRGILKKKVPNGINDVVYLNELVGCAYVKDAQNVSYLDYDFYITFDDIHRRIYNYKNYNDMNFYYHTSTSGEVAVSGCSVIRFALGSVDNPTYIYLDDYFIGQESFNDSEKHLMYIDYNQTGQVDKAVHDITTIGTQTSSRTTKYNYQGQVIEESDNGIVKTYTRNDFGLVTEEKVTSGAYNIIKTYVYDSNADKLTSFTDEHGVTTTFVTDDFWGTVTSETCGGQTKTYAYDDYHTEVTDISQGTGTAINNLNVTGEDWETGGYSSQKITENSSLLSENRIVDGRLTRVGYGTGNTSFALSSMTYDDTLNTETDTYSARKKTFDAYDRLKSTKVGSNDELAIEYNVPGWHIDNRPGYGCDKVSAILDYKASEKTTVAYEKDENDDKEIITYTTTNLTGSTTKKTTVVKKDTNNRPETEKTTFVSADLNSSKFETVYKNDFAGDNRLAVLTHTVDDIQRTQSSIVYDTFRRPTTTSRNLTEYVFSRTYSYKTTGTRDFNRVSNVCETYNYSGTTYNLYNVNFDYVGEKIAQLKDANNSNAVISKYTYDALGRLVREDNATLNQSFTYAYNTNGTLASISTYAYTTGTLGTVISTKNCGYNVTYPTRLTTFNNTSITYNSVGRVSAVGGKTYNWSNDRFTGYTEGTFATGRESYLYSYNGKGQRIQKKYTFFSGPQTLDQYITSQTDKYVYDTAGRLINLHRQTNWNQATLNSTEKLVFFYDTSGVSGFLYKKGSSATKYYFTKNTFGDIVGIKNVYGATIGSYSYDAFGKCTKSSTNAILTLNPFRYRGYFYDEETGCYFLESRYYNPEWHRFLSPDHPSYIDTEQANCLDLYAYCANDPVNYVDPTGEFPALLAFVLIGAAVGAVSYVASETISYALTGEWNWSWGQFVGNTIGGALGGLATGLGASAFVADFIASASTTLIGMGLQNAFEDTDYSEAEILLRSLINGVVTGLVSKYSDSLLKISGLNVGRNSFAAISKQIATKTSKGLINNVTPMTMGKILVYNLFAARYSIVSSSLIAITNIEDYWFRRWFE